MATLARCIDKIVKRHGSLRATARTYRLDAGYLSRLRSGEKTEPSDETLRALGIERVVTYRMRAAIAPTHPPEIQD